MLPLVSDATTDDSEPLNDRFVVPEASTVNCCTSFVTVRGAGTVKLSVTAGTAPKALVFNEMTTKIALGAVVMRIPSVTDFDRDPLDVIETGDWVIVDGDAGTVEVEKRK